MKLKRNGMTSMTITIGIVCFILFIIIFMQFKVVRETDLTSIDTMRKEDLETELASWKTKYEETEAKYEEVQETLNKYKQESTSDEETKKNLEEELNNLQLILGLTDVEGEGIVITIKETEDTTVNVDSDELMQFVNYLKEAGAEAISINDQRVVNTTDYAYISSTFIKMNSKRVSSPFVIKAIGNQDYLKSVLIGKDSYVEQMQAKGQEITVEDKKKVEIQKYDGDMSTKYIEEDGE